MHIYVFFKIVPKLEDLTEDDWRKAHDDPGHAPLDKYARTEFNPEDEAALELALRARDTLRASSGALSGTDDTAVKNAEKPCITAVTFGLEGSSQYALLHALGFDSVICLSQDHPVSSPQYVSEILSAEIEERKDTLVLTGCASATDSSGLTPMFLAHRMGWPLITEVLNFTVISDNPFDAPPISPAETPQTGMHLDVENLSDDGLIRQQVKLPIILAVGNAPSSYLRVPTLKERLSSSGRQTVIKKLKSPRQGEIYPAETSGRFSCPQNRTLPSSDPLLTNSARILKLRETKLIENVTAKAAAEKILEAITAGDKRG
jgi:electron transfer flavoprotein alpha/beta subunit